MIRPRPLAAGVRAAVEAPAWTSTGRLARLLEAPEWTGTERVSGDAAAAIRVARSTLARLAPLRRLGGPWRSTCLHHSIAACLLLRRHGVPATLRLGARGEAGGVAAHAWVEGRSGRTLAGSAQDYTPLARRP